MRVRTSLVGLAVALLLVPITTPAGVEAQEAQRPLRPLPPGGLPVTPFMEGWYDNGDGTYTISFGYLNRNREDAVEIPVGEDNSIEPAEYDGMQPTTFLPGRHRGVFGVTIPEDRREEDVWWSIRNRDGEVHRVPGRTRAHAYELDWNPRPHGSVPPVVWFESEANAGRGPSGVTAEETLTVAAGRPLTLTVHVRDPSERDPEDQRFREPVPVRVVWSQFRGPGVVAFERHESTPEPEEEPQGPFARTPGPEEVTLPGVEGTARVVATFPEPGEYVLRAQADNFAGPDSSSGDQCCWSNGYVRVNVSP